MKLINLAPSMLVVVNRKLLPCEEKYFTQGSDYSLINGND